MAIPRCATEDSKEHAAAQDAVCAIEPVDGAPPTAEGAGMSAPGDRAQTAKGPKGNRLGFAPERSGVGTCFQQLAGVFACLPRRRHLGIDTQRQGFSLPPWRYFKRQYCPPGRPPGKGYFHLQGTAVVDPVDMWPSCKRCRSEACWGYFLGGTGKPGKVPQIVPPRLRGFNCPPLYVFGQKKPRLPMGKRGLLVSFVRC